MWGRVVVGVYFLDRDFVRVRGYPDFGKRVKGLILVFE